MKLYSCRAILSFAIAASFWSALPVSAAHASAPPIAMPDEGDNEQSSGTGPFDFLSGITKSGTALGNMWGLRPWLSQYGVSFGLQETSEILGNVSGGTQQGFAYDGLTQMALQMDTQRAFGFYGGTFNISALQIHGHNLSAENLGTIQTSSGIEADRATRLWELWYDQKMLGEDRLDVKVGQQSIDQEFMVSSNALLFVNTMFGWPALPSYDMPGGGPAYPLSALGVRARAKPTDSITVLAGVFNGSPTGKDGVNTTGANFPTDGGLLAITELQYMYPSLGSLITPDQAKALSGTYKIGAWYDTQNFADQRYDNTGVPLAISLNGTPQEHHGNYAIYGVADQMLWQSDEPGEAERTISFFTRAMGTPLADRNFLDFTLNAGFVMHEPFEHRDDDTFGIGMGYAHVSSDVAKFDEDQSAAGNYTPRQNGETYIEATYQYQMYPWWYIQPDFQYIFHPGAGTLNPNTGNQIRNEAVLGVRTIINF